MGGDGGGGGGGDASGGLGNASFGNADYGGSLGGFGMGFGEGNFGGAAGSGPEGGSSGGPGGGLTYGGGGPVAGTSPGYGGLGTPYPTPSPPYTSGGNDSTSFTYPTSQEVYNTVYGLPHMTKQADILKNMSSMPAFRSAVLPEVQGVMKTIGRSGMPSSSWADRAITDTMGSLYNKWMWNVLTGYQNIGAQMPGMMNQWYQPYNTMLAYVGS